MQIKNFLSSLLPTFGKDRVLEDCRITRTEIKEFTQPAYDIAAPALKGYKFKSESVETLFATFSRMVKDAGRENPIVYIQKSWKPILENLDHMEKMVEKTYSEEVAGIGLTYMKANLLQFVEALHFVSKYARKFLLYVYICETAEYEEGGTSVAESLTPSEMEWITANIVAFCTAFNVVSGNPNQVEKKLADIPDVVITEDNVGTLSATMGEHKIDPFQMKLIPVWMNPIYHIGMFVAEWQATRYKAAKEELRLVQLRKLNLEKVSNGKPDAAVQKEIAHLEDRIQDLNYRIHKLEKDNA
jgi:hypothetical protein